MGKLRSHKKFGTLGFFISLSGFTSPVKTEIKLANADGLLLVPISKKELMVLANSKMSTLEWLESLIGTMH
ncbi:hypothetical protein [uncultured Chitinophaga sp.]|uniref:hypothetical protein n=1 Tax=uncultured Chitinophaga sp. TaxID=339340 RepID=UPI00345C4633